MHDADDPIDRILRRYAAGDVSAVDAAFEIQLLRLTGFEFPSASEVILMARARGHGIPTPSLDEARSEAARILNRRMN